MAILPILIYKFSVIPLRIPAVFFWQMDKLIPKFIWKCKGPRLAKSFWKMKNKIGVLTLPDSKPTKQQ